MKQKIILTIAILSIFITGCSLKNDSTYVEEGKKLLESHEYKQAMKVLSSALEEDNTDDYARAMYMQAMRMLKANEYEEKGNYDKAIEELELIEGIKNGSSNIRNEASNKKSELQKLNDEAKKSALDRKQKAKYTADQDRGRIESEAESATVEEKKEESNVENNENTNIEQGTDQNQNQNQNNNQNQNQNQPNTQPPTTNTPSTNTPSQ